MAVQTSSIADPQIVPLDATVAVDPQAEIHPDVALVERAKAGDTAAFEQLVRQYDRQIFRTAQHITQNREDAEDITQDVSEWRPNPEQNYSQSELAEILRKTIAGLPPGFRTVFTLRDIENLSTEETAEALSLSVPAVKSRLLRARLQLRERLSRYFRQNKEASK